MNILLVIVILLVLIVVHEFGHFIVAKRSGIRVDEFGVGFPPRAWGKKIGETLYSINWLPFGGFVKIFGEDPEAEDIVTTDRERSFYFKPALVKAGVLVAGVVFNWLLAWLLVSVVLLLGMPTLSSSPSEEGGETVVTDVVEGSPAANAGLISGDIIVSIKTFEERFDNPDIETVQGAIGRNADRELLITYKRSGEDELQSTTVTPFFSDTNKRGLIGVSLATGIFLKYSLFGALWHGLIMTGKMTWLTLSSFGALFANIFAGDHSLLASVTGPVGLVGLVGEASRFGLASVLFLAALISINLSIINLVPFPALDGGRVLFLVIEKLKGSPIQRKVANIANAVGFGLLILLMVLVTANDVIKL